MENYCVICGEILPEGRLVCPLCEAKVEHQLKSRIATKTEPIVKYADNEKEEHYGSCIRNTGNRSRSNRD